MLNNHKKKLEPFAFNELQKIVFLIDEYQDISLEINVLKELCRADLKIYKVVYLENVDDKKVIIDTLLTSKYFNWYNAPKKEILVDFLNEEYDLVIDLTLGNNKYKQIFMQFVNSKVIVGFKSLKEYSVNLNIHDNNLLFVEELLRYLSTFKR